MHKTFWMFKAASWQCHQAVYPGGRIHSVIFPFTAWWRHGWVSGSKRSSTLAGNESISVSQQGKNWCSWSVDDSNRSSRKSSERKTYFKRKKVRPQKSILKVKANWEKPLPSENTNLCSLLKTMFCRFKNQNDRDSRRPTSPTPPGWFGTKKCTLSCMLRMPGVGTTLQGGEETNGFQVNVQGTQNATEKLSHRHLVTLSTFPTACLPPAWAGRELEKPRNTESTDSNPFRSTSLAVTPQVLIRIQSFTSPSTGEPF